MKLKLVPNEGFSDHLVIIRSVIRWFFYLVFVVFCLICCIFVISVFFFASCSAPS